MIFSSLKSRLSPENILFSTFCLVYSMQCFWLLPIDAHYMYMSAILAFGAAFLFFPMINARYAAPKIPASFFCAVIPLVFAYLVRLGYPDASWDVVSRRIIVWEKALRGAPFSDYNIIAALSSCLNEMMDGVFFHLLGYRLGTIINLLAVIWLLKEVYNILFLVTGKKNISALGAAFSVLGTENIFFEINTYMPDLLGIPFFFYGLRITLTRENPEKFDLFYVSLIYGISFTLKWTNAVMAAPAVILILYGQYRDKTRNSPWISANKLCLILSGLLLPSIPSALYFYKLTGNPIFPMFNAVFNSHLFPALNFKDYRWGPSSAAEAVFWPITASFSAGRISEIVFYSWRMFLGCVSSAFALSKKWPSGGLYKLCFVFIAGAIGWAFSTGYIRYGIILDVIAGMLPVISLLLIFGERAPDAGGKAADSRRNGVMKYVLSFLMITQFTMGWTYGAVTNWSSVSWGDIRYLFKGFGEIFRDYKLENYLREREREILKDIDGYWLATAQQPFQAHMTMLKPETPYVAHPLSGSGSQLLKKFIEEHRDKKYYSICDEDSLDGTLAFWRDFSLLPVKFSHFGAAWFDDFDDPEFANPIVKYRGNAFAAPHKTASVWPGMILTEYRYGPEKHMTRSGAGEPASDVFFKALIDSAAPLGGILARGEKRVALIRVKNISGQTWYYENNGISLYVGRQWLNAAGEAVKYSERGGIPLLSDLAPNDEIVAPVEITAPSESGEYALKFDVSYGDVWFESKGSSPFLINIRVE